MQSPRSPRPRSRRTRRLRERRRRPRGRRRRRPRSVVVLVDPVLVEAVSSSSSLALERARRWWRRRAPSSVETTRPCSIGLRRRAAHDQLVEGPGGRQRGQPSRGRALGSDLEPESRPGLGGPLRRAGSPHRRGGVVAAREDETGGDPDRGGERGQLRAMASPPTSPATVTTAIERGCSSRPARAPDRPRGARRSSGPGPGGVAGRPRRPPGTRHRSRTAPATPPPNAGAGCGRRPARCWRRRQPCRHGRAAGGPVVPRSATRAAARAPNRRPPISPRTRSPGTGPGPVAGAAG